jgi:Ankyrin repeats (3 copies)
VGQTNSENRELEYRTISFVPVSRLQHLSRAADKHHNKSSLPHQRGPVRSNTVCDTDSTYILIDSIVLTLSFVDRHEIVVRGLGMASAPATYPLHHQGTMRDRAELVRTRIPIELQAVFVTSQQGHHQLCRAPPNQLAATTFCRSQKAVDDGSLPNVLSKGSGNSVSTESMTGSSSSLASSGESQTRVAEVPVRAGCASAAQRPKQAMPSCASRKRAMTAARTKRSLPMQLSPQIYLDALIRSRGYCTERFQSLQTAYSNAPTPLQQASYHVHLINLVRRRDVSAFRHIMGSGISPNPCNQFGESLLHTVCRRGDAQCLQVMLDAGARLNVCDDRGRTPLHDACWVPAPCFDVVDMILERDPRLLYVVDCRGSSPLQYIPKQQWPAWLQYLESRKDAYWPPRNLMLEGLQEPPALAQLPPNSCPVPDPPQALSADLAKQVSAGQLAVLKDSNEASQSLEKIVLVDDMIGSSLSIITHRHAAPLRNPLLRQAMAGGTNDHPGALSREVIAPKGGAGVDADDALMVDVADDVPESSSTNTADPLRQFVDASPDKVSSSSDDDDEDDDSATSSDEDSAASSSSLDSSDDEDDENDDDDDSSSSSIDDVEEDELLDEMIRISQQQQQQQQRRC